MILVYHEISNKINKNENNVHFIIFTIQILILKTMRKKIVALKQYNENDKRQVVLRFDDVDKQTLKYVLPILKILSCPAEFFVVEDFVNSNNGYWADIDDLKNIVNQGHRIQYHSKSHKNLTQIDNQTELIEEIIPPEFLLKTDSEGMEFFAYPYWVYNEQVIEIVKKYFKGALSGNHICTPDGGSDSGYVLDGIKMKNKIFFSIN